MSKKITESPVELTALFPPDTAGRDMITNIPVFNEEANVGAVLSHLLENAKSYETVNYVYVIDSDKTVQGVISMKELFQSETQQPLNEVMKKNIVSVKPMDQVPHVALLALQHNLKMIPIVDHKQRLIGAFGSQQILDILNKEFSNDLLRLSGIRIPRKHFHFNHLKIIMARLPWMFIGMLGGLATGFIINAFKSSIEAIILLAVFIPVIMSTGATSANQSAMIFLRNLMHGDIKGVLHYIYNELKVSSVLGAILSSILFLILAVIPGDILLGFAVSISLFLTIQAGALIGVLTPMILHRFKIDASIGAGPFLTIIKDLIAMTIYFGVATLLLSLFR